MVMLKCGILARINGENQASKIKNRPICLCNTSTALFLRKTADAIRVTFYRVTFPSLVLANYKKKI